MEELLNQFRKGSRSFIIVKRLIEQGGEPVARRELIVLSVLNPVKRVILNRPELYVREKEMLKHTISKLRPKLNKMDYDIAFNRHEDGYYLFGF